LHIIAHNNTYKKPIIAIVYGISAAAVSCIKLKVLVNVLVTYVRNIET